jgi:integrase
MSREATISVILYVSKTLSNGEHPLMLRVTKEGKRKYISLGISCKPEWWDIAKNAPKRSHPDRLFLEEVIDQKKKEYRSKILELRAMDRAYTPEVLAGSLEQPKRTVTVWDFFDEQVMRLKKLSKLGNARAYQMTKDSLQQFYGKRDLLFQDVDVRLLNKYETWLRSKNLKDTSLSVYFRTLRALFSKAVEEKLVSVSYYPFKDFKISKFNTKTRKRAITKEEMYNIIKVELPEFSKIWEAKQYFTFMYYAQGINFKDMALLRWRDLVNGRLHYTRAKTKQLINFRVTEQLQVILDKFRLLTGNSVDNYIFPILDKEKHQSPQQIEDRVHRVLGHVNVNLKEIGKMVGLPVSLNTYAARHTYATVLKYAGADIAKISQALGHTNLRTTEIYLKSFENEEIDKMNEDFL